MSNYFTDTPCPICGKMMIAFDMRGKYRSPIGGYYQYGCDEHLFWYDDQTGEYHEIKEETPRPI